jgi:hypothetical protein
MPRTLAEHANSWIAGELEKVPDRIHAAAAPNASLPVNTRYRIDQALDLAVSEHFGQDRKAAFFQGRAHCFTRIRRCLRDRAGGHGTPRVYFDSMP